MCAMPDATPPTDEGSGASGASDARRADHAGDPPAEPVGPAEAEGPLSLQRYRKRDGRQLILFARHGRGEREP
jgi:hypothetical protein